MERCWETAEPPVGSSSTPTGGGPCDAGTDRKQGDATIDVAGVAARSERSAGGEAHDLSLDHLKTRRRDETMPNALLLKHMIITPRTKWQDRPLEAGVRLEEPQGQR